MKVMAEQKTVNKQHYHIWKKSPNGEIFFRHAKMSKSFGTRQAARQHCIRRGMDSSKFMILECWEWKCRPKLDK